MPPKAKAKAGAPAKDGGARKSTSKSVKKSQNLSKKGSTVKDTNQEVISNKNSVDRYKEKDEEASVINQFDDSPVKDEVGIVEPEDQVPAFEEIKVEEEQPAEEEKDEEARSEAPSGIQENVTIETRGQNIGQFAADVNKSFNATEQYNQDGEEKFFDPAEQPDNLTEVGRAPVDEMTYNGDLDFFGDGEIQPNQQQNTSLISPQIIEIVQNTWAELQMLGVDKVGTVLFKNIFKIAPGALELFSFKDEPSLYTSEKFKIHARSVTTTIGTAVQQLNQIENLVPTLVDLGFRHARRGVLAEHYPIVGQSLMNTLKAGLKKQFTPQVKKAWDIVFKIVSDTMMSDFYNNPDQLSDELTDQKIEILQNSWNSVLQLGEYEVGCLLFKNLFEFGPDLISLFNFTNDQDYENSAIFKSHAQKVLGTVTKSIQNLHSMESLVQIWKGLGMSHLEKGVQKEDYNILKQAFMATLEQGLGPQLNFELKRAWSIALQALTTGMISDNYEVQDKIKELITKTKLGQYDIQIVVKIWRKVVSYGIEDVGDKLFTHILRICPEIQEFFSFSGTDMKEKKQFFRSHGAKVIKEFTNVVASLENVDVIQSICQTIKEAHSSMIDQITGEHHVIFREALLATISDFLDETMSNDEKHKFVKVYNILRNLMMGYDPDDQDWTKDPTTKMSVLKKRIVQNALKHLAAHSPDISGPLVYKHTFEFAPEAIVHFPFKDQKNYLGSAIVKKQASAVLGIIQRGIVSLDEFDKFTTILNALGHEHRGRNIVRGDYDCIEVGLMRSLQELDPSHFDPIIQKTWEVAFFVISEKMLNTEEFDHKAMLEFDCTEDKNDSNKQAENNTVRNESSDRGLIQKQTSGQENKDENHSKKDTQQVKKQQELYVKQYRKEVDFHHKVAYRFEKAYRLGKKMEAKRQTLNLEVIDCISEHQGYIETDPMTLFYLLFFCIYFKNTELMDFVRSMIQRIPSIEKIDKLLEYIDVNGVDKIRSVGEQVNQIVYHLVFYQAIDDDLRIVYSSIMRQCRFLQLRDKDAHHLLNQRDYELIRLSFDKHITKMNMDQFGYAKDQFSLKCHSYRKYNQAFFEEIVINNDVEERVALNYRERFLVSAEDIYIVFDMYCKEDYDEQFIKTKKHEITHKQFVDLFVTCLKNDSMKIAMIIYTLFLDINKDMDERIMEILMLTLKESVKFHEIKLFFIHEHFDTLTIQQMNTLIDTFQLIMHRKDWRLNPIVSQYNTIKVVLLIYRICWKIENKQIYSLITKCSLLQSHLISSLSLYFEKQNNIITLYKFMLEPILHMTERMDSLDVMYQMNMQTLLKHPVVIEVLNLVNEGKYSVSSNPISMSQTFQSAIEMSSLSIKSINDRLIQNFYNFGTGQSSKQTSLQFNIWRQSIDQRQNDEMVFTSLISFILIGYTIYINTFINRTTTHEIEQFGKSLTTDADLLEGATKAQLSISCPIIKKDYLQVYEQLQLYANLMIFYAIGMITSVLQKLTTIKVKDNAQLSYNQIFLEAVGFVTALLYIIAEKSSFTDNTLSDNCIRGGIAMTDLEAYQMDKIYTLGVSPAGRMNLKYINSAIIIQLSFMTILMLQRTQFLGELILMLGEMISELGRFSSTFGLVFGLFILIGRFLSNQFQHEVADYWQVFLDLFNALNGNPNFENYTEPIGQIYIAIFLFLFKILLMSLLAAMFINKYKQVYKNLDAYKRLSIIRLKNCIAYDKFMGGITTTFFPINIFILPFIPPTVLFRSQRISDFLLKLQYIFMIIMYCLIVVVLIVPMVPILYVKVVVNAVFILFKRKRQNYKGENVVHFITSVFASPVIICLSLLVDLITLPNLLFKESKNFEHKYQQSEDSLTDQQIVVVMSTFEKIFYGLNFVKFKDKHMTLIELMRMHRKIFSLIDNLHDLTCRGNKDYKEALSKVQDYNMTKILTKSCSIPDSNGDFKESKVELNIIHAVQWDMEYYNYIDVVLRKLRMGTLAQSITDKENGKTQTKDESKAGEEGNDDEEDDETKKIEGILKIEIGPDGNPLKRNVSDVMNNFFINLVCRSFTEVDHILAGINQNEKRRQNRFNQEVEKQKEIWKLNTVSRFQDAGRGYENLIKKHFLSQGNGKNPTFAANNKDGTESTGSSNDLGTQNTLGANMMQTKNDTLRFKQNTSKTMIMK